MEQDNLCLVVRSSLSQEYIDLLWHVFFKERHRGIEFSAHFPWVLDKNIESWSVQVQNCDGEVIGGLTVKEVVRGEQEVLIGSVGLVCIHPKYRGEGYAAKLLSLALQEAMQRGYDAMVLWTRKWELYQKSGFSLVDSNVYGSVDMSPAVLPAYDEDIGKSALPSSVGLPAFATKGCVFFFRSAEVVVVQDGQRHTVAKWSGNLNYIIHILKKKLPAKFWLNANKEDPVLTRLKKNGAALNLKEVNLQMINVLNKEISAQQVNEQTQFDLLDRV